MIHTRRTLQNTRLLLYLTLLNWYKWTLSRADIDLPSPSFSPQSLKTVSGQVGLAYLARAPDSNAVFREDHLRGFSFDTPETVTVKM